MGFSWLEYSDGSFSCGTQAHVLSAELFFVEHFALGLCHIFHVKYFTSRPGHRTKLISLR